MLLLASLQRAFLGALAVFVIATLGLVAFSSHPGATSAQSGTTVRITAQGLDHSEVTIQAGGIITWTNETDETVTVVGGLPYHLYLPVVTRGSSASASQLALTGSPARASALETTGWSVTVPPGGEQARAFANAGSYSAWGPASSFGIPGAAGTQPVVMVTQSSAWGSGQGFAGSVQWINRATGQGVTTAIRAGRYYTPRQFAGVVARGAGLVTASGATGWGIGKSINSWRPHPMGPTMGEQIRESLGMNDFWNDWYGVPKSRPRPRVGPLPTLAPSDTRPFPMRGPAPQG